MKHKRLAGIFAGYLLVASCIGCSSDPENTETGVPSDSLTQAVTDPIGTPAETSTEVSTHPAIDAPTESTTLENAEVKAPMNDITVAMQGPDVYLKKQFSAVGDGVTHDTAAIRSALAHIGAKEQTLVISGGQYAVTGPLTVPKNVTLRFESGASLLLSKGASIDLQGKVLADAHTIFAGEGQVTGNSPSGAFPQWFGGAGLGADDSALMQKAVDVFAKVWLPVTPAGYRLGGIRLTKPVVIQGVGGVRTNILRNANQHLFILQSDKVAICDLYVMGNGSNNQSDAVIFLDTEKQSMTDILIRNVHGIWNGYALKDAESTEHTVSRFRMEACTMTVNYNITFHTTDLTDGLSFVDVIANNVPNVDPVNYPGWYMENVTGMFMDNIDAAGGLAKGNGGDGFVFVNCQNVHIERGMQDYVNGIGLKLVNCSKMDINNMVCSLYEGYALYLENVTDSTFNMVKANGIYPSTDVLATRGEVFDAVYVKTCANVTFNNLTVQYNQTHGLTLENSTDVTVNSYCFSHNNGDPYRELGTSDRNILNGVICADNYKSRSTFTQVGQNSEIKGVMINQKPRDSVKGPATVR